MSRSQSRSGKLVILWFSWCASCVNDFKLTQGVISIYSEEEKELLWNRGAVLQDKLIGEVSGRHQSLTQKPIRI